MKKILFLILIILPLILTSCSSINKTNQALMKESESTKTQIINEESESEDSIYSDNAEQNLPQNENSFNDAEATIPEDSLDGIGGGRSGCQIHDRMYHSYCDDLINYIGDERFFEWQSNFHEESDTGCIPGRNLYDCIEYFDIPNDAIIEIYQNNYFNAVNWNLEALLARDKDSFENSARIENIDYEISDKMASEMILKHTLLYYMELKTDEKTIEYYNIITDNGSYNPICDVSIYEMIANSSLTREDFLNSLAFATAKGEEMWVNPHFEYNLDLLFGDQAVLTNAVNELDIPYYESTVKMTDALLHAGEENNNHVAY